jgi:hypothetical protein
MSQSRYYPGMSSDEAHDKKYADVLAAYKKKNWWRWVFDPHWKVLAHMDAAGQASQLSLLVIRFPNGFPA